MSCVVGVLLTRSGSHFNLAGVDKIITNDGNKISSGVISMPAVCWCLLSDFLNCDLWAECLDVIRCEAINSQHVGVVAMSLTPSITHRPSRTKLAAHRPNMRWTLTKRKARVMSGIAKVARCGAADETIWCKANICLNVVVCKKNSPRYQSRRNGHEKGHNKSRRQASSHFAFRKKCHSEYAKNSGCERVFSCFFAGRV